MKPPDPRVTAGFAALGCEYASDLGGATAFRLNLPHGHFALITGDEDCCAPTTQTRCWMIGVYAPDGGEVLYGVESLTTEAHALAYCRAVLAHHAQPLPNLDALSDEALNAAVAHIQEKLGVDSGDFASHFFDERNSVPITLLLFQYARAEIAQRLRRAARSLLAQR